MTRTVPSTGSVAQAPGNGVASVRTTAATPIRARPAQVANPGRTADRAGDSEDCSCAARAAGATGAADVTGKGDTGNPDDGGGDSDGANASRAPAPNSQARVGVTKYAYAWSASVQSTDVTRDATTTRASAPAATARHPAPCRA